MESMLIQIGQKQELCNFQHDETINIFARADSWDVASPSLLTAVATSGWFEKPFN
jgi:hypothetical protein